MNIDIRINKIIKHKSIKRERKSEQSRFPVVRWRTVDAWASRKERQVYEVTEYRLIAYAPWLFSPTIKSYRILLFVYMWCGIPTPCDLNAILYDTVKSRVYYTGTHASLAMRVGVGIHTIRNYASTW